MFRVLLTKQPSKRLDFGRLSSLFVQRHVMLSTSTSSSSSSSSSEEVVVEQTKKQPRRRRRSARFGDTAQIIPSYKEFVHRFTVLSMYRNFLKTIRCMPHNQEDLKAQVQRDFRAHKNDHDPFNIQRALGEGKRRFQELQGFTGQDNNKYEGDSWMKIKDPEDSRGRVGEGWPWQQQSD